MDTDTRALVNSELSPLREDQQQLKKLDLGRAAPDILQNDHLGQFVLTFPIPVPENEQKFATLVEDPKSLWAAFFPAETVHSAHPEYPDFGEITLKEFTEKVVKHVVKILGQLGCEVHQFHSVDDDELFVAFGLRRSTEALHDLAIRAEARVRVAPQAYAAVKSECPTDEKVDNAWQRRKVGVNLKGQEVYNECPLYVRYTPGLHDMVEEPKDTEVLRILRRGLRGRMSIVKLLEEKVANVFFAVHKWDELKELEKRGWNDPTRVCYWPYEGSSDSVEEYFGAPTGLFFHFYNSFSRWVFFPAAVSIIIFLIRKLVPKTHVHVIDTLFGLYMCLWTTFFLSYYQHDKNVKLLRWGMTTDESAGTVRREFDDARRGTARESFRKLLHWFLCCFFICETLWFVYWATNIRAEAVQNPSGKTFGLENEHIIRGYTYAVTLNIKLVDCTWSPLSMWLSKKENHRTDMELKSSMAVKLFAVKFVVFYFPFVYDIVLRPRVEGCPGDTMEGCIHMARGNLKVVFVTQIISGAIALLLQVAFQLWSVKAALRNKKGSSMITFLEVQALMSEFDVATEVDDFMQIVLSFGFLAMFGTVCPVMCMFCFVANLALKKLLAFRFSFAQQRVVPQIDTGLDAWMWILQFLAYAGVTCSCYIVIFMFLDDKVNLASKLLLFILSERAMGAVKMCLDSSLGKKSVAQQRIEECNEDVLELLLLAPKEDQSP
ncbi:unnamed protein product [Effrenium voratum]|nr:unnamed protein product [Effrenium voratum]|mmetsp:Transcript_49151/g.117167  ORF Transcript_49151/g.117167 Transcript_49151/m.117167 type:complete len:717 (+) Transcript_49151:39-2189(+)